MIPPVMPANLTPQYFEAEERYKRARDDRERLAALREMLSTIPKHKGTEKLQADIKRKIAQIRVGGGKKGGSRRAPSHGVERSGAAQIVLVGPPNSGKSRFVADQSSADPEVADYPFTTRTPTPGIVTYRQVPLQFVDLPPITPEHIEPWMVELVRNADLWLVLLDLSSDELLDHWDVVLAFLEGVRVSIDPPPSPEERPLGVIYRNALVAANKMESPGAGERLELLLEILDGRDVHPFSLETGENLEALLRRIVEVLDLIRVYTKLPGKAADMEEPYILARGSTVEDAARGIHKELAEKMRFARAWGERFHDGQPVGRDTVLEDGDVLEFHE
jgi:ribosome-interacting GTPase 1